MLGLRQGFDDALHQVVIGSVQGADDVAEENEEGAQWVEQQGPCAFCISDRT